jgi:transposase
VTKTPQLTHELVNDVPLLMHILRDRLALDQSLDAIWPRHGNWQGLSPGQVLVTWLTHVLSEGDHRMNRVQDWANTLPHTLSTLWGQPVRSTDLGDDRLAEVVRHLSLPAVWHPLEQAVSQQIIRVYRLKPERVRLDTTSVSVYADRDEVAVLFQHGHSKDHRPDLRQFKVMLAALDPLGVVVAADVVAGHRADDGLYLPTLLRLQTTLGESGMLYIGDAKMGALATGPTCKPSATTIWRRWPAGGPTLCPGAPPPCRDK